MMGSTQMLRFAEGLMIYANGGMPEPGQYPGEQNRQLALDIASTIAPGATILEWAWVAGHRMAQSHKIDLDIFGVVFDTWSFESSLNHPFIMCLVVANALGKCYKTGLNDQPICGNCARLLLLDNKHTGCASCIAFFGLYTHFTSG